MASRGAGTYDARPAVKHAEFMRNAFAVGNRALGNMRTLQSYAAVAMCNQDLRQDNALNVTMALFEVWNERETDFGFAWECVDAGAFLGRRLRQK